MSGIVNNFVIRRTCLTEVPTVLSQVITKSKDKKLRESAARRLTGMRPKKRGETWVYPKSADMLLATHTGGW